MDGQHEHHHSHLTNITTTTTTAVVPTTMVDGAHGHGHHGDHDHGHHSGHSQGHITADTPNHNNHQDGGHQMKMWFHGGCTEVVLFDFWRIDSFGGLLFSCLLVFLMASAYEGLKWFRVHFQLWANSQQQSTLPRPSQENPSVSFKGQKSSSRAAEEALIQSEDEGNGVREGGNAQNRSPGLEHRRQPNENNEEQVYVPTVTPAPDQSATGGSRKFPSMGRIVSSFHLAGFVPISPATSRWFETGVYCIQLTLAYWLMLIAMTYNVYLTTMVVLGAGFGHWLFAGLDGKLLLQKAAASNYATTTGQVKRAMDRADDFASDACH